MALGWFVDVTKRSPQQSVLGEGERAYKSVKEAEPPSSVQWGNWTGDVNRGCDALLHHQCGDVTEQSIQMGQRDGALSHPCAHITGVTNQRM